MDHYLNIYLNRGRDIQTRINFIKSSIISEEIKNNQLTNIDLAVLDDASMRGYSDIKAWITYYKQLPPIYILNVRRITKGYSYNT